MKTALMKLKPKTILITTYLLNIFDALVSVFLFKTIGIEIELNPFGVLLYNEKMLCFYKFGIIGAALILINQLVKKYPRLIWACWIVFSVYFVLAIWHVFGMTSLYTAGAFNLDWKS